MRYDAPNDDTIIVDREGAIDHADSVVCLATNELRIGYLRRIADELYMKSGDGRIKFSDCQVAAPVIGGYQEAEIEPPCRAILAGSRRRCWRGN